MKKFLVVTLAVSMVICTPVLAASKTTQNTSKTTTKKSGDQWAAFDPLLKNIFDEKAYADAYPELKKKYGYNETKLLNHYLTVGAKNGYKSNFDELINLKLYHDTYTDL